MELERQSDSYCKQISFHVDWEANHLHISAYHSFLFPTDQLVRHTKLWEGLKKSIAIIIVFWTCSIIKIELM